MGYRTLSQALEVIKAKDEQSAISLYFLRTLARSGKITILNAGGKVLVHMGSLAKLLELDLEN